MKRGQLKPKTKPKSKSTKRTSISNGLQRVNLVRSVAVPPKKQRQPTPSTTVSLSKCALRFALACSDPFNVSARGACIPSAPSHPSQKVHAFARFDATVGVNGFGFVAVAPSLANDAPCLYYTSAGYTGFAADGIQVLQSGGVLYPGVNAIALENLPYNSDNLTSKAGANQSGVYGKIVSVGLRAQYTGTTLNEGGLYYCLQEPSHDSISNLSVADIGFYADADVMPITRTPCMLILNPVREQELNWANTEQTSTGTSSAVDYANAALFPYSKGSVTWAIGGGVTSRPYGTDIYGTVLYSGVPVGATCFTGTPGNTIHFEYITHVEYAGTLAAAMQTRSEADAEGAGIVMTAVNALPAEKLAFPGKSPWSLLTPLLKSAGKAVKKFAVPALEAGLTALLV